MKSELRNGAGAPLRLLVVGASSGIGAATAGAAVSRGALVVGVARRPERVAEIEGVIAATCDVTDPRSCESAVAAAVDLLGGIDALVYAAGTTAITPLARIDARQWQEIFATNIIGAALISGGAIPYLTHEGSDGRALFLSSDSVLRPYPGLVAYASSKAALAAFCQGLASEFPQLRVSEMVVGPTIDTEVGTHFDPNEFHLWFQRWCDEGFVRYGYQLSADVAEVVITTLSEVNPAPTVMATAAPLEAASAIETTEVIADPGSSQLM